MIDQLTRSATAMFGRRLERRTFLKRMAVAGSALAVAPVDDVALHPRLHALLSTCLADNRQAWDLAADGTYTQRTPNGEPVRATHHLLLIDSWGMVKPTDQRTGIPSGVTGSP